MRRGEGEREERREQIKQMRFMFYNPRERAHPDFFHNTPGCSPPPPNTLGLEAGGGRGAVLVMCVFFVGGEGR